ncbi:MAG: sugar phosphate nucleotidyltransferase [Candidatus Aminicenantes bacterium]
MKVVLFCGGQGMRLREYSETIPKPMVEIGYRPILWHVMKYYAHFGHREFILCLGHRADVIKKYFVNYEESLSNNFVLTNGGRDLRLLSSDIGDWKISFIDTGLRTNVGQRLRAVESHLERDEMFLANYADGLSDLNLPSYLTEFRKSGNTAAFLSVRPTQSAHVVSVSNKNEVSSIQSFHEADIWINGGFFIFRREIFKHIKDGEELVEQPFKRLIASRKLMTRKHRGFWMAMDTFKDKRFLDDLMDRGQAPWEVWKKHD